MNVRKSRDRPRIASLTVAANESELWRLRSVVTSSLRDAGVEDDVVDDMELAASELATNVIQHTSSPTITVAVRSVVDGWELEVADADDIPELAAADAVAPSGGDISGRGLFIVQAVMDKVELVEVDDVRVVRCTKLAG